MLSSREKENWARFRVNLWEAGLAYARAMCLIRRLFRIKRSDSRCRVILNSSEGADDSDFGFWKDV